MLSFPKQKCGCTHLPFDAANSVNAMHHDLICSGLFPLHRGAEVMNIWSLFGPWSRRWNTVPSLVINRFPTAGGSRWQCITCILDGFQTWGTLVRKGFISFRHDSSPRVFMSCRCLASGGSWLMLKCSNASRGAVEVLWVDLLVGE